MVAGSEVVMPTLRHVARPSLEALSALVLVAVAGCGVSEFPPKPASASGSGGAIVPTQTGGTGGEGGRAPGGAGGGGEGGGAGGGAGVGETFDAGPASDAPPRDARVVDPTPGGPLPPGGPPAMGATRDKIVVFLHIGHSNMAGRATVPATLKPYFYDINPRLWSFHGTNMTLGTPPLLWRPAKEPLSPDGMTGTMAGPGMAILQAALAIAAPDVFVVSVGHGHSGGLGGTCSSYKKGGLLYDIVMGPARALRGHVTFGGIFTMLGTTERHLDVSAQTGFADCMARVAADMRGDLGDPEIPFIMSDFEMEATGDTSPTLPYAKIIIAQLRVAQMKIPRAALIPTEMLGMEGSHHFNMAGHREWGLRGVQIMKDMGWAPWAK
jgi:hypothetical protein